MKPYFHFAPLILLGLSIAHALEVKTSADADRKPLKHEVHLQDLTKAEPDDESTGFDFRGYIRKTVFPEFRFSGTFEDAIGYLMAQSKAHSPDGRMVGGFVLKNGANVEALVDVELKQANALEVIDDICGQANAVWAIAPYAILVGPKAAARQPAKPKLNQGQPSR
jgi:hypothetical protein